MIYFVPDPQHKRKVEEAWCGVKIQGMSPMGRFEILRPRCLFLRGGGQNIQFLKNPQKLFR